MKQFRIALLLFTVATASLAQARQLAIIAEKANNTSNLTTAELTKIFTTKSHTWPDGTPVTIVMRDPTSPEMQVVLRKLFNMTPDQVQTLITTHHDAIIVANSDEAVLRFVSTNRGALGVIDLYSLTKDVNVVKIDGKLPVQQDYLLRGN
jgi:ABC-type phosphate transport system substrate-binding protein